MRHWWVNQNQTFDFEVPGGFLWSPKTKANGGRHYFYEVMQEVRPGDLVFSFAETYIKAIGVVQRSAVTSPKPNFRNAGSNWSDVGWFVEVEFAQLDNPIRPRDFMPQIIPLLEKRYAPLQENGNGLQGVYLTEISVEFGKLLIDLSNANLPVIQKELAAQGETESEYEVNLEIQMRGIPEGDLETIQITKARRGQGLFKTNVRMVEDRCRVTGVTNVRHLRASHIKPWAKSSNEEKLDGFNGLLLSPHIDHLFDQGFISFEDRGGILVSRNLNPDVLKSWSIEIAKNVGDFRPAQKIYLEYHRDVILQH
ncbi:MAG: HNH endonuclease signature motif containing protein [Candidatus Nanopelagicaceae bacterium]